MPLLKEDDVFPCGHSLVNGDALQKLIRKLKLFLVSKLWLLGITSITFNSFHNPISNIVYCAVVKLMSCF